MGWAYLNCDTIQQNVSESNCCRDGGHAPMIIGEMDARCVFVIILEMIIVAQEKLKVLIMIITFRNMEIAHLVTKLWVNRRDGKSTKNNNKRTVI